MIQQSIELEIQRCENSSPYSVAVAGHKYNNDNKQHSSILLTLTITISCNHQIDLIRLTSYKFIILFITIVFVVLDSACTILNGHGLMPTLPAFTVDDGCMAE